MKIGHLIGLAAVAAILAAAAQFTERRSVPNWAPNAAVAAKPKPTETVAQSAALPDGKVQAALPASTLPPQSSEIPAAARSSTPDPDATGGLPKEAAPVAPAPDVSPAPVREHRQAARPARQARAPEAPAASRPAMVRDPIQFRLAEGNR
ncbi:MAG TPA: hypothetical protein VF744_10690 [Beijerinckiaceae bacterium]|jgi:hypothetical protein